VQSAKLAASDRMVENRTFDEIAVGDGATLSRTVTQQDIELFGILSGDVNPAYMDPAYADADMFHKIMAQGMLEAGLIPAVLGAELPGPGTIYLGQNLRFLHPVSIGDRITAILKVTEKHPEKGDLTLDCRCINQEGELVIRGTAYVRAPIEKVRRPRVELPEVRLSRHERFRALLAATAGHEPLATAVAYPCYANALGAAVEAAQARLITPILVGPKAKILKAAEAAKVDIALLSAVETVNPKLRSTLDAAALCKMVDRGQITGGLVDGPLAFDNAVSPAAAEKGIVSKVAGRADILVVLDLEAGNILAKQLTFLAGADAAGVVLGARVPIILTSRADAERTRMASCAVAVRIARRRAGSPKTNEEG
jgi:acyl dehydratase